MAAWLLLFALTAFAAFAALGAALRAEPDSRSETAVLWTGLFVALIVTPVLGLGHANQLRPGLLAAASFVLSTAAFFASARGRAPGAHARAIANAGLAIFRLPWEGFRLALRARSFATLGLAAAALAIGASAGLTYLAPSESWDGFFYHEPMVGFALQNQGFRMVSLPDQMVVQAANGYPRLCQAFALWFVVFTDKTLIEIGNTLAAPGLMLATFGLARRYCKDTVPCLAWGAAVLLVPAMFSQLRTSMIDVQVAFFLIAAVHYATRPVLRFRDAGSATLFLALALGSKSAALAWVPPIALVAYGRLLLGAPRPRRLASLALTAGGLLGLAGVAASTFARNWLAFGNPLWPVTYTNARLGIAWRGLATLAQVTPSMSFQALVERKYHHPTGGVGDILARDYGYGVPWVVVPLAALSLAAAVVIVVRRRLAGDPDAKAENLLLVAGLGAAFVAGSPSLAFARFNIHVVAIAMVCVAFAAGRLHDAARFHEGAIASTLILSVVPWIWTGFVGGLELTPRGIGDLLRSSPAERATMHFASFQMPTATAQARERELGPGDLVVFTQETTFPGVLWNHRFSNRVEYVSGENPRGFLARIDELQPRWVVVGGKSGGRAALESRRAEWELVGVAVQQDKTVVFRRKGADPGAP